MESLLIVPEGIEMHNYQERCVQHILLLIVPEGIEIDIKRGVAI